jgi:hypothetical protein
LLLRIVTEVGRDEVRLAATQMVLGDALTRVGHRRPNQINSLTDMAIRPLAGSACEDLECGGCGQR